MSAPSQRQGHSATTKWIHTPPLLTNTNAAPCYQWQLHFHNPTIKSTDLLLDFWQHQLIIVLLLSTLLKTTQHTSKSYKMPFCLQLPLTEVPYGSPVCGPCWSKLKKVLFCFLFDYRCVSDGLCLVSFDTLTLDTDLGKSGLQGSSLFLPEPSRSVLNLWPETCCSSLCGKAHSRSERSEVATELCYWFLILPPPGWFYCKWL